MKTRFFLSMIAVAAVCLGGRDLKAQYPVQMAPGYSMQPQLGAVPGSPIVPAAFAQPSPFGAPAAFIPASPALAPPTQVIPAGHQAACDGKGCGKGCDDCSKGGKGESCHRWEVYGEFLYIRARDAEIAYAVPFDGPVVPPANNPRVQVGAVGVLDPDFQPGFRFGFNKIINDCTRVSAEYTMYESGTSGQTVTSAPNVIHSLVSHPATATAAQDFLQSTGQYDISMDMVDLEVRRLFINDCDLKVGWLLGVRAASQEQQMRVNLAGTGTETVSTDVDFTGVGLKFGIDGDMSLGGRWLGYANLSGSFLPGVFQADFDQSQSYDPVVIDTGWEAGRVVTIWDLELGISRVSQCGNYRVNAGYMFSAWTNTVQTDEWIEAVHTNNFINMDSTMTFDGLVARFEARY